ncbi:hypothetical protein [Kangiella sediminilitoris]|uniref:Uncharacterized protein n=1 Tax=Kangiella sediminilitoris TaxID=1144748 RepID=A0A1B3B7J9_9GAMM|nr:hypothetical protein [Kangiella sediminilitoris]AOE48767.1 hypothetical protein KS2013_35 [Kangiella sediminilitoris]
MTTTDKEKPNRESSNRWQGRTIEQFGYALNLIVGLAVAAIGFELSLMLKDNFQSSGWQNCLFSISLFSLIISVALGLFCIVNRLRDFRITAKVARKREDGASELELQPLRIIANTLGERAWLLFWWVISSFGIGLLLLCISIGASVLKVVT